MNKTTYTKAQKLALAIWKRIGPKEQYYFYLNTKREKKNYLKNYLVDGFEDAMGYMWIDTSEDYIKIKEYEFENIFKYLNGRIEFYNISNPFPLVR